MKEINFNELWQSQKVGPSIDAESIISKAKHLQRKTSIKILLNNLLLFATIVFIIGILLHYNPQMITTKIGSLLVIFAIVMQIVASSSLIPLLNKSNEQTDNATFLNQLLAYKKKQAFIQSIIMTLYFIFLGLGLLLYMIEYVQRGSMIFMISAYGLTISWIAFNWFYVRPKTIKKQQEKCNDVIANFENITIQFSEEK